MATDVILPKWGLTMEDGTVVPGMWTRATILWPAR